MSCAHSLPLFCSALHCCVCCVLCTVLCTVLCIHSLQNCHCADAAQPSLLQGGQCQRWQHIQKGNGNGGGWDGMGGVHASAVELVSWRLTPSFSSQSVRLCL